MKAVIKVGGKQYIVSEAQTLLVDKLDDTQKELNLEPLLVFDEKTVKVGTPVVKGAKVTAQIIEAEVKGEKIKVAHFESKKRVKKINGHRQTHTRIKIGKVTA